MTDNDNQILVRIDTSTKEAFIHACHFNDRNASQVLREFLKTYIAENEHGQRLIK
jgi:hypothetical protein